jgi:hypothetical protein
MIKDKYEGYRQAALDMCASESDVDSAIAHMRAEDDRCEPMGEN